MELKFFDKILKRITPYLRLRGWPAQSVGMALLTFELNQGEEAVKALGWYLDYAEAHGEPSTKIATTIEHDFESCDKKGFVPKTSAY